jgi:hypothetical protein
LAAVAVATKIEVGVRVIDLTGREPKKSWELFDVAATVEGCHCLYKPVVRAAK